MTVSKGTEERERQDIHRAILDGSNGRSSYGFQILTPPLSLGPSQDAGLRLDFLTHGRSQVIPCPATRVHQLFFFDDSIAILDQNEQDIEGLWHRWAGIAPAQQRQIQLDP